MCLCILLLAITIYGLYCISVGVPFPSELEPEKSATASPVVKTQVSVKHCGLLLVRCVCLTIQLDSELRIKTKGVKPSTEENYSKLVEIDKKLDKLEMEVRQNRARIASAREAAEVIIEDVKRLEQEKQLLLEETRRKERELDCFKRVHDLLAESQREKEDLQESIKIKENELREAKAELQEKEKQLEKYKEKIQKLKKRVEDGVRELGVRDGRIFELEKDKARAVAEESEKMKVRIHLLK